MSTETRTYPTRDAAPKHWHSRRHETPDAHNEAKSRYQSTHCKRARQESALARLRQRVARYHSLVLSSAKPKKRAKSTTLYVPNDLQKAIDISMREIEILELKLNIRPNPTIAADGADA